MLSTNIKNVSLKELLEHLLEARDAEVLKLMDERYQKGYKDALDMLFRWYASERKEVIPVSHENNAKR